MEKKCYCTPAVYCPDDNVTYPPIQCDYCIERELQAIEKEHEMLQEDFFFKPVSSSNTVIEDDDDLPF